MNRLYTLISILILYVTSAGGQAFAAGQVNCPTGTEDVRKIIDFTQNLRIALSQGDVTEMQSLVTTNYVNKLSQCSQPTLQKLCDLACFDAIGQYYLFMSSEIAYYYSKNDSARTIMTADELQGYVNEGLKIVNAAKAILEQTGSSAGNEGGFRNFVIDATRFDILKIRLYMATGDNWYQSMSEQWLRRLDSMIAAVVEEPNGNAASSSALAVTNYEEALWTLTETMMGIPDDPSFASFQKELIVLNDEINRRIQSVESGFLYIGIDPMANSMRPVSDLKNDLKETISKIADIETKVEANLDSWLKAKANQQFEDLNSKARQGELSVSLSSYKIAKIETEAAQLKTELDAKVTDLQDATKRYEQDSNKLQAEFDLTNSKIQLQFQLQKRVKEINDRIALLNGKKEIDVLNFNQSRIQKDIENLKWVMNWDIARTNLTLQESSYLAQRASYLREKEANSFRRAQALLQKQQLENAIADLNAAISGSDNDQKKFEDQKTNIGKDQLAAAEAEICNVEQRIARLGGQPEEALTSCNTNFGLESTELRERQAICAVRAEVSKLTADEQAVTLKCGLGLTGLSDSAVSRLSGINCATQVPEGMKPMLAQLNALAEKEAALEATQVQEIEKKINAQQSLIDLIQGAFESLKLERNIADSQFYGQAAVALAQAVLPKTETCACGVASGQSVSIDPGDMAYKILKIKAEILDRNISYKQYVAENASRIVALENDLNALRESLEVEKMKLLYSNLNRQKLVNDLYGEAMTANQKLNEYLAQEKLSKLECDNQQAQAKADVSVLLMDHKRLLSELSARKKSLSALNFDIERSKIEKDRYNIQIGGLALKIQEVDSQIKALGEDDKRLDELIKIADSSSEELKNLKSRLNTNESELALKQRAEKELTAMIESKTLNLTDEEIGQLKSGAGLEQSQTDELVRNINSRLETITKRFDGLNRLYDQDLALSKQLTAVATNMHKAIEAERKVIFDNLETAISDTNSNEKRKIFVMTQDEIAQMVRGVPSFINSKRRLVEEANEKLVALRNKVNRLKALTSGAGSAEQANGVLYVKTAQDIQDLLRTFSGGLNPQKGDPFNGQVAFRMMPVKLEGALLQTALTKGSARFEISPFTGSASENITGNSFSVGSHLFAGDPNLAASNHTLMDIFFEVSKGANASECPVPDFFLRHGGSGYVFKTVSESDRRLVPSMVAGDPTLTTVNAFAAAGGTDPGAAERKASWQGRSFDLVSFDAFIKSSENRNIWPLIGLPVVSSYELVIPRTVVPINGVLTDCTYTNITAWVVYAYRPNIL